MEDYKKKYMQALERAKVVNSGTTDYNIVTEIFPELKESEDERIRKWLIKAMKYLSEESTFFAVVSKDKVISWLEKQGEQKLLNNDKYQTVPVEILDRLYKSEKELKELKQGEQKPTDEVEPKFKVGDWIISNDELVHEDYRVCRIKKIEYNKYFINNGGFLFEDTLEAYDYHLWTIKDAKDGDVLTVNDNVFIYAHRKQLYSIAVAHCFVNSVGDFCFDGEFGYTERGNSIYPATKEQRDKLEKAITAAWYKWNKEDLKLEKI